MARNKPAMIYKGTGFFVSIPARDLTKEEVEEYGGEEYLESLGLYEKPESKRTKAKSARSDKAEESED